MVPSFPGESCSFFLSALCTASTSQTHKTQQIQQKSVARLLGTVGVKYRWLRCGPRRKCRLCDSVPFQAFAMASHQLGSRGKGGLECGLRARHHNNGVETASTADKLSWDNYAATTGPLVARLQACSSKVRLREGTSLVLKLHTYRVLPISISDDISRYEAAVRSLLFSVWEQR